jgi:hypothetical protein
VARRGTQRTCTSTQVIKERGDAALRREKMNLNHNLPPIDSFELKDIELNVINICICSLRQVLILYPVSASRVLGL